MQPIYSQTFTVGDMAVDRYGRLRPGSLLFYAQEAAGQHCKALALDYDTMAEKHMFWAIIRHRVQITRLPMSGETITVETWPMPTTRSAFPRSVVAYDQGGRELFRTISLWVLMDMDTRAMILPGKSGVLVPGTLRGTELPAPGSLIPKSLVNSRKRSVCFTDLDRNGHMNNTKYMEWIDDLLPSEFHFANPIKEFTVCYLSEAREGQELTFTWEVLEDGTLRVDAHREKTDGSPGQERIFAASIVF